MSGEFRHRGKSGAWSPLAVSAARHARQTSHFRASRHCLLQPPRHTVYTNRGSDYTIAIMLLVVPAIPHFLALSTVPQQTAAACFFTCCWQVQSEEPRRGGNNKILVAGISSEAAEVIWLSLWHAAASLRQGQAGHGCGRAAVKQSTPQADSFFATPAKYLPCITRGGQREDNQPSTERGDQTSRR